MKDRIVWLMIMVMCLTGYAQATKCIIIGRFEDAEYGSSQGLIDLMETMFDEVEQVYSAGWQRCNVGTEQDALNAADLIVITRQMASGNFQTTSDRAGNPNRWWDLDTPVISLSGYPLRGANGGTKKWNYATDNSVPSYGNTTSMNLVVPAHAYLAGTTGYPSAASVEIYTSSLNGNTSQGAWLVPGTLTIANAPDGRPILAHIPGSGVAGVEFAPRSDCVLFALYGDKEPQYNLATEDCDTIMTNIAYDIVDALVKDPNFNPPPSANAGADQAIYLADTAQLAGTATDEGPENPAADGYPGGVTSLYWYQQSGPGTATFIPADGIDELNPTVTFTAAGDYEVVLKVTDGFKDANDIVVVRVVDPAAGSLVGHWPFDGDALDASVNSNDGTLEGEESEPNGMPTYTTDAAVGTHSIDVFDYLNLEATDSHDPNLPHVALGAATELDFGTTDWTVSGWVKTTQQKAASGDVGKGTIFGNGGDTGGGHRYCLIVSESNNGRTTLVTDADSNGGKFTTEDDGVDNDGAWHFILGVREWGEIRIYRDGVLEGTNTDPPDDYDLSGTSQLPSYIGVISDWNGSAEASTIYKHLNGLIDDVRVYNYALPLDDATCLDILDLTAMGPIVASVDAGGDLSFNWKPTSPPTPLAGVITDLGRPDVGGFILWTTADGPLIGAGPDFYEATFTNADQAVTTVTFTEPGVYTLKLEVYDPDAVDLPNLGYVSDTVVVTVIAPTCADVILDGLLLPYDFDEDCYVGLSDLVIIIDKWAQCNDPLDVDCPWPF